MNNKNLKISNELLENSKKIFDILEKIYIHYHTKNFVSKTNLINNKIDYENAIKLALFEEIIALRTYQEFKEYNQYSYKKQFEDIIIFKICNINLLNLASLN